VSLFVKGGFMLARRQSGAEAAVIIATNLANERQARAEAKRLSRSQAGRFLVVPQERPMPVAIYSGGSELPLFEVVQ
jgi:hypothetical protein